ncbi:MAG: hypothetical protein A2068_07650 [Ignavibacteria bacterium GWB2_35_6b]|nr:MAG: hypothetical protein A2068_07650 [Ignavibacteria bacterium GWB2_35_6b]
MKNKIFHLLTIVILNFFLLSCEGKKIEIISPGTTHNYTFQYTDDEGKIKHSQYILSVPSIYNIEKQYPLFVTLTGGNYTVEEFHKIWKLFTDSLGVVLVTPMSEKKDSADLAWNENSDFMILSCMDRVAEKVNLNPDKIFVGGFYEGGTLAYKLGFKYSQIFKGVAAISAKLPEYYKTENLDFLKSTKFFITAGEFESDIKPDADKALELMIKYSILTQHIIYFNVEKGLPEPMQPELKKIVKHFFDETEK